MNIEALIAAKKAQRVSNGFAFRITFDNRVPFNGYYSDKATFDEQYARAVATIVKFDRRDGCTALSVEVL